MSNTTVSRRKFIKSFSLGVTTDTNGGTGMLSCLTRKRKKPNFIIIFCDDMGYGDLGCFGPSKIVHQILIRWLSKVCASPAFIQLVVYVRHPAQV